MEKTGKEFEFKGGYLNGFLMIFIDIVLWFLTISCFILGIVESEIGNSCAHFFIISVLLLVASIICCCGFSMLEPNQAKVMTFFGKYVGTFRKTGFYWLNPFMGVKNVSLRARNLNADPIKVNDKMGNPILIGLVVVWRLKDTYKAIFDIDTDVSNTAGLSPARSGWHVCLRQRRHEGRRGNHLA